MIYTSGSQPLWMRSSLCSFWNFSFLPYENFHFSPVRVRRLVLITIGTMMFNAVPSLRRASWDLAPSNKVQSLPQTELWNINRWSFNQISEYKALLSKTLWRRFCFIDDNNLKNGTKTVCCQLMALKFVNKNV